MWSLKPIWIQDAGNQIRMVLLRNTVIFLKNGKGWDLRGIGTMRMAYWPGPSVILMSSEPLGKRFLPI